MTDKQKTEPEWREGDLVMHPKFGWLGTVVKVYLWQGQTYLMVRYHRGEQPFKPSELHRVAHNDEN